MKTMYTVEEAKNKIAEGRPLALAGDEKVLKQLPAGNWIAGTIPYFIADEGGKFSQDEVYLTEFPDFIGDVNIRMYNQDDIKNIYKNLGDHQFGLLIIPASSPTHISYALNAPTYENFAIRPVLGWVSGVFLDDLGKVTPKVFYSQNGVVEYSETDAVVMEITLPEGKDIIVDIVNIFESGHGDEIQFNENSFSAAEALVNGEKVNFSEYVRKKNIDTKLPLVTEFGGTTVNVSFQSVEDGVVNFYAPVFRGLKYRHAQAIKDYVSQFEGSLPIGQNNISFSCNCILNYLYSELENKKTGGITGPVTFGEIAYQLLNQTMVYMKYVDL